MRPMCYPFLEAKMGSWTLPEVIWHAKAAKQNYEKVARFKKVVMVHATPSKVIFCVHVPSPIDQIPQKRI